MATSKGPVKSLFISPSVGKVTIHDEIDNRDEGFVLWNQVPAAVSDRIIHSMYVSLAREAIAHGKRLSIGHGTTSALVTSLTLEAGP